MSDRTEKANRGSWLPFFLAALVAVLATILSSATASAATQGVAETRVRASAAVVEVLVGQPEHIAAGQRLGNEPVQVITAVATGVAAEAEAGLSRALGYSEKIETQMGPRGWTRESIESTVKDPAETHPVWDYTTGDKMPATAYVQRGGGYVVVNDESGELVQVSNLNKSGWKPVWEDPRFAR